MEQKTTVSLIIPVFREKKILAECLRRTEELNADEVIVVAGDGEDYGDEIKPSDTDIKFISAGRACRAFQMNLGAEAASSDVLVFIHADMSCSRSLIQEIRRKCCGRQGFGACFKEYGDSSRFMALYAYLLNTILLGVLKVAVGTNAMFISRSLFMKHGGYPDVGFMEDILFWDRMKKSGLPIIISHKVTVSSRRYVERGRIRQMLRNASVFLLYYIFRVHPDKLKKWYLLK